MATNAGVTAVSLFGDTSTDLIVKSFEMGTGTSMLLRVMVLANTRHLAPFTGDADAGQLFGSRQVEWSKSSFAAVPFDRSQSSRTAIQLRDRAYVELDIHEGNCWLQDIQFFDKRTSSQVVTYAVLASIKQPAHADSIDDMHGASTLVQVYKLEKVKSPNSGFAGFAKPIEFVPITTTELPKASCNPSKMTVDYERLVQQN